VVQSIAPVWSHDGNCVFIAADYLDENGFHRIIGYQVHFATGKPVLLGDIGVPSADTLVYFSQGGARTLLGNPVTDGISVVDFATGVGRGLASGHAPVWSPDGRHVAYSLTTLSQDGLQIDEAFVINFDGTNEHALTKTPTSTPDIFYTPADWSPDSRKVLVNRTTYDVHGIPVTVMYIIDATTLARTKLASGSAEPGAWYKPAD
jgi:Tol biopolymer transport system component